MIYFKIWYIDRVYRAIVAGLTLYDVFCFNRHYNEFIFIR